jgi:hypothetical protein
MYTFNHIQLYIGIALCIGKYSKFKLSRKKKPSMKRGCRSSWWMKISMPWQLWISMVFIYFMSIDMCVSVYVYVQNFMTDELFYAVAALNLDSRLCVYVFMNKYMFIHLCIYVGIYMLMCILQVCIYMYIYWYTCIYACTYICTYISIHIHTCTCEHMNMYIYMHMNHFHSTVAHIRISPKHACFRQHIMTVIYFLCLQVRTSSSLLSIHHWRASLNRGKLMCIDIEYIIYCLDIYVCTYIFIYMHVYIHTYTYKHI